MADMADGITTGHSAPLQKLAQALKRQSKFSAAAASCAALSAVLQAIELYTTPG